MSEQPENFTLALLREMRGDMAEGFAGVRSEIADLRSEVHSLRADVASDLMTLEKRMEKRFDEQIGGLRRAVMEYHSSAVGHGVLLTEFEERLRRLEKHVGLPPEGEAH